MKKIITYLLFSALLNFCYDSSHAQPYYEFSSYTQPYESIVNPTYTITDSSFIDTNIALIHVAYPSSDFKAFGQRIPGIIEAGTVGYIVALGTHYDFVFDPLLTGLRSNGKSEFHAKEVVRNQDTILQLEWKEFGIANHPNSDYVTFKAELNINQEIIEFHYGPSNITQTPLNISGPNVVLIHFNKGFTRAFEMISLGGDPQNPTTSTLALDSLDGIPASGTVYKFKGKSVTGIKEWTKHADDVFIYPNPAAEKLVIRSPQDALNHELVDQQGRSVLEASNTGYLTVLPLVNLKKGTYVLISTFKNGKSKRNKVIIE